MNIKTITTADGVNAVDFGSGANRYYWFRNLGTTTVYVSGNADISADADGVAELAVGNSVCIETLGGKVYILGAGKIEIHNTGDKFPPFRNAPVAGGGVDGYSPVTVNVKPLLVPKTITANGTYLPSDNVDGFSSVYVRGIPETQIDTEKIKAVKNGTILMEKSISNGWNLSLCIAELYSQMPEFNKSTVTNKPYIAERHISERALFLVGTKDGEFKFAISNETGFDGQPVATESESYRINNVSGEPVLYQIAEWGLLNDDDEFTKNQIEFNSESSNITINGFKSVNVNVYFNFFWKTTTYADGQPSYSSYSKKQSRFYNFYVFGNGYYLGVGDRAETLLDFSNACNDFANS